MPKISEFFGLSVYMYWFDIQKHRLPHIHVKYGDKNAVFDLLGNVIEGNLGYRAHHLIREWCVENQADLQSALTAAVDGKDVPWINPLR